MENLLYELAFLSFLGLLYYLYQRRKILRFEENKGPLIMGYILQACLSVRGESPDAELDPVIEALDDYLHNKAPAPPEEILRSYAHSEKSSPELRDVILQGLEDLGSGKD